MSSPYALDAFTAVCRPWHPGGPQHCDCSTDALPQPEVCSVANDGCLAPAGWASEALVHRAQIGLDHDGVRSSCFRCGNAVCVNCSTLHACRHQHPNQLRLCPDCVGEEAR